MPEAIPAPAAIMYNAIPAKILREPEMELAKEVASKIGRGTILDIGSGTGFLATEIAKKSQIVEVIGIDLSREMIRISKRHSANIENVHFNSPFCCHILTICSPIVKKARQILRLTSTPACLSRKRNVFIALKRPLKDYGYSLLLACTALG